ncbi:MAG: nucleotidyltransferase [Ectothiorhodospiraceae bacterium]|nr:MAG: nucleotidyltransferase [Ectothiorhodospiraceae bacterium]
MKVIILSSGKGTRMMPLTKDTPKPMLEINGEYLLENKINLCRKSGLNEITINVAYKKNVIINYIKTLDIDIHLVDEGDEPLGTAQGIRNIIKSFDDEQFIVINSDIWTDYNLKVLRDLKLENNLAHIVLTNTPDYLDGDFSCDGRNLLVGDSYVFSGIGKYHRELFIKHSDVELGDILRSEEKITFSIYDGKWMDIGTPERLEKVRQLEQDPT